MRTRVMLSLIAVAVILWASLVAFLIVTPRSESPIIASTIAETVPLEPLSWEAERPPLPTFSVNYHETINRYYLDDGSINETVGLQTYYDQSFWLDLNVTVNLITGYVDNINVTSQGSTPSSQLVAAFEEFSTVEDLRVLPSSSSSFISFYGVNLPRRATLRVFWRWFMSSPDNQTEQATLTVDVTYFNGTADRKATCPLYLKSPGCMNTKMGNAEEIKVGQTITKRFLGYYRDHEFYRIYLNEGEEINITAIPDKRMGIYLYVYNSSDLVNPNCSSGNLYHPIQNIVFTVKTTSWYFIDVNCPGGGGDGTYVLRVDDLQ